LAETRERAQAIIRKLADGETLSNDDLIKFKTVCKAVEVGTDGWISDMQSQFPAPRDPEVSKVLDSLNIYKAQLLEVMNCANTINAGSGGDHFSLLTAHIVACNFANAATASAGIGRQAGDCTKIIRFFNNLSNAVKNGNDISASELGNTCLCKLPLPFNDMIHNQIKIVKSSSSNFNPIDAYKLNGKYVIFEANGADIIRIELESEAHADNIADYIKLKNSGYVIVTNMDLGNPSGLGHNGLLVRVNESEWRFYSKNGRLGGNPVIGGNPTFEDGDIYSSLSQWKSIPTHDPYNRLLKLKVSNINAVMEKALVEVMSRYIFLTSHCGHAVNSALKVGGIKVSDLGTFRPNAMFEYLKNNNKNYSIYEN
jgi:hypothetical protein